MSEIYKAMFRQESGQENRSETFSEEINFLDTSNRNSTKFIMPNSFDGKTRTENINIYVSKF